MNKMLLHFSLVLVFGTIGVAVAGPTLSGLAVLAYSTGAAVGFDKVEE